MKAKHLIIMLLCTFLLLGYVQLFGQDEEESTAISPFMELKYLKNTQNQRTLNARIFEATDIGENPLSGLTIKFYANIDGKKLLGEIITDADGFASYIIPDEMALTTDEENNWQFYAEFDGNEAIETVDEEVSLVDVHLEMAVSESEEDGRQVRLTAFTITDGEKVPVTDEDVFIFVPRMFSLLPVGEGYFENGEATIDFPNNIPGSENGSVTVIGRFEDHYKFANVEKRVETIWGVPSSYQVASSHRALWTQVAPLWMIITLSIMLAGVWGHYVFAIISIIKIKKEGKNNK